MGQPETSTLAKRSSIDEILSVSLDTWDQAWMNRQHLAVALRTDINSIDKRINQALKYCSGYHRRERSYKQFRNHKGKTA